MEKSAVIEVKGITKTFGKLTANKNVTMDIRQGEILSVLGENGCGKTTLMNMIAGIYYPDAGQIFINGEEVKIASPKDAFRYKIGMIHQHFKLIDVFSAAENVALGIKDGRYNLKLVKERIVEMCDKYGFNIDPDKKIHEMSVSEKQTVEIIKVLYRGADILILDEPTAVLTPQEIRRLFNILRAMREDGKSIVIITHKLNEVMEISDRVTVMRKGEHVATVDTASTNEHELTEMMVGQKVELNIERPLPENSELRLDIANVSVTNIDGIRVLDNVSFCVNSGEILGIAGIAGSGQRELLEAIAGLQKVEAGASISYLPPDGASEELIGKSPLKIRELGVRLSFVPEDRLGMGLVGSMDIVDNMMLRSYRRGRSALVDRKAPADLANEIISSLQISTPSSHTEVRKLSGGNVQKVLVGREIAAAPSVLMAAYPVRGLDINSSYTIYNLLTEQKKNGVAVIFVGEDLDVLLALCDRILVISAGKVAGIVDARTATKEEIGLMMVKTNKLEEAAEGGEKA